MPGLPNVSISIQNGGLGRVAPSVDKVAGLIVTNKVSSVIPLGTAFKVTSKRAVKALEAELTVFAKRELDHFFNEAGDGSELWVMPVVDTKDTGDVVADHLPALITAAAGRIRIGGISLNLGTQALTDGQPTDFVEHIQDLQEFLDDMQLEIKPSRFVVGSYGFAAADIADLADREDYDAPNVGVVLVCADNAASALPVVGLTLGRLAANEVQVNIGRVKDGPISLSAAYVGRQKVEDSTILNEIHDAGYIIARSYPGVSGYFFSDDPTVVASDSDFSSIARGRTIDKALTIVYAFFVNELNDNVQVDPTTGRLPIELCRFLEGECTNALTRGLGASITTASVFIDPDQNILSTDKLSVEVRVVPVGYFKEIEVELGFSNPFVG
jgi:hypothetical protein